MINKYLMNSRMLLVAVLLTAVTAIKLTHQQTYNLACCPKGMTYDRREYICVCPPGTEPSGPNKICCPPGTIGNPFGSCDCPAPKHYNPSKKQCE